MSGLTQEWRSVGDVVPLNGSGLGRGALVAIADELLIQLRALIFRFLHARSRRRSDKLLYAALE